MAATIEFPQVGLIARARRVELLSTRLAEAEQQLERAATYSKQQSVRLARNEPSDIPGASRRLTEARALIVGIEHDLSAERQRLDQAEGIALAERNQQQKAAALAGAQHRFEDAQVMLNQLKAEFTTLPSRIAAAGREFDAALGQLQKLKGH